MKKFLVIGNPINHSLSPKLHNYWIKQNGLNAIYEKKKLNDNELESLILDVFSKSGLDPEEARNVIKNRLFMKIIDEDWKKSKNYGVTGVPTYVYQKQSMVGAQPFENLVEFLNHFGVPKR